MATKNIHITAISPFFEIHEIVPENKAVARLIRIKKQYLSALDHFYKSGIEANLKVTTGVHNPTLF